MKPVLKIFKDQISVETVDDLSSRSEGVEAVNLRQEIDEATQHQRQVISLQGIEDKFETLAATWQYTNENISSIDKLVLDPAYQELIGMGKDVLPFIFRKLNYEPDHWFWALRAITGVDPVKKKDRGNLVAMTQTWLEWAKQYEYIR